MSIATGRAAAVVLAYGVVSVPIIFCSGCGCIARTYPMIVNAQNITDAIATAINAMATKAIHLVV